jgi:hypothetical protein
MALVILVSRYGEELRADFRRYYHLDLLDMWRDGLSVQEVSGLAVYLPPGSLTWQRIGGPGAWTPELHLLAAIEYADRYVAWTKTADSKHGKPPEPIKPPKDKLREEFDLAEMEMKADRLAAFNSRRKRTH